jgi:enoyl-CoA hydratase
MDSADSPAVRVEIQGQVTTIVMNRPERRNAVDGPMARALRDAFAAFEADDGQRVAVLWGDNGCFCAGADLTAVADPAAAATRPPPTAAAPARWGRPASTSASR